MVGYGIETQSRTRDLSWGIELPLDDDEWVGKCVYVWFEAVQDMLLVHKYGRKTLPARVAIHWAIMLGKSGGISMKMDENQDTSIS